MEEGTKQDGSEWPTISDDERTLFEILFYSQGPVDGYILGEGVQDLFLKSGLPLRVLSQVWNLADVSNDNVLNVHEFVLVVHLVRGLLQGLKLPQTLPRKLTPPKTEPVPLQPATQLEKESYLRVFEALDTDGKGYLEGDCAREVFRTSGLSAEVLSRIWDLSDVNHDGKLDVDEFCVACHLLRFVKQGNCLTGPVDVFVLLPGRVADQSLQARKQRVQKYEQHKQKLMLLKEKRKIQVLQENQRLQLHQEKVDLLRQWYKLQQKSGLTPESEEAFKNSLAQETEEIEKQEEVVLRLKKEHEKIRQETVRIILAEQKLSNDIATIKKDTDELNKRLSSCHTHATKDPDPFHQFYEQRKEKRQGSTIQDLDKINIYLPFTFSPFDPGLKAETISLGKSLFDENVKHPEINAKSKSVIERLHGFGEEFLSVWGTDLQKDNNCDSEGDPLFKEVPVSMDEEKWLGLRWGEGGLAGGGIIGLNSKETEELQEKLLSLKLELQKLNQPGSRLVFRNPEDYYSRKRGQEEEDKPERVRSQRRSGLTENLAGRTSSGNNSPRLRDRHSYAERNEDASQAVREYRKKRQSVQSIGDPESSDLPTLSRGQETPKIPERPSRSKRLSSSSQIQKVSTEEESGKQTLSSAAKETSSVEALAGDTSVSSSHFQPILTASDSSFLQSSGKKLRAPQPPSETTLSVSSSSENSSLQLITASAPSPKQPAIQRTISNPSSSSEPHSGIFSDSKISESQISAGIRSVQKSLTTESILIHSNTPEVQAQAETHILLSERPARPKRRRDSQNTSNPSSPTDAVTQPPFSEIQTSVADKQSSSNVYSPQVHSKNSFELSEHFAVDVDVPNAAGSVALQPKITDDLIVIKSTSAPKISTGSSTANSTESLVKVVLKETDLHRKDKTTDNFTNTKVTRAGPCASIPKSTSRNDQFSPGAGPSIVHSLKEDLFPKNFEKVNTEIEEDKLVKPEATNSFSKKVPPSNPPPSVKKEDKVDVQYAQPVSDATRKWSAQLPESLVVGISTENSPATKSSFEQILLGLGEKQIKSEQVLCVSETSSTCDSETESVPPPLPASPPPPLPTSPPPFLPTSPPPSSSQNYLFSAVDDKVIEVKKQLQLSTPKTKKKMEEANVIDIDLMLPESLPESNLETQKSIAAADLYSDVFGFNAQTVEDEQKHSTRDPFLDLLENPHKTETISQEAGLSADSDVSDDREHEGTYSLGDSNAQMSSLLMPPDNNDGEIQLISFSVDQSEAPDKGDKHAMTTKQLESSLSTDSALGDSLNFSDIESKRPKSLEVKESNSSSSSDSCLSPTGSLSSQDMTALSPKSREIVEKARHFAEMVQKPNFVVKRENPGADGLGQEALQDFELERRAVIMQSTVRRKDVGDILSPSKDKNIFCSSSDTEEEVQQVLVKSSQELEDVPSPARSVSPEARWNGKQGKVIVYSENIVQEPDSSEAVDRESIANLASTRKQWETILSADIQEYPSPKPKKTPSKWEVRLSYKDRNLANSSTISSTTNNETHESGTSEPDHHIPTVTSSNMAHIESAIERDIRLAHEREEMLRLEQNERMRRHQHSGHKMSSMESSTESELQPMYYELAEADRGADVWRQHEYEEPEEAMQRSSMSFQKFGSNLKPSENSAESIIEREIRLQREREAELAQQRGYASPVGDHSENSNSLKIQDRLDDYGEEDNVDGQYNEITYEEAIIHSHTEGESLIARELRELREREEEVRQQRKSIIAKLQAESLASSVSTPKQQTESVQPAIVTKHQPKTSPAPSVPRGSVAAARTPLVNVSVSRNMHASLHTDSTPQTQNPAPKQETPIEREIRLARERENELRRAKGLPELNPEPSEQDITKEHAHSQSVPTVNTNRRQPAPQPDASIRRFASNRLQQEILDQKKRELALRQEGKIITTSEEHIQPLKYSEITGQDKVEGTVKRNFKMPGNKHGTESPESVQDSPPITPQTQHSQRSSNVPTSGNKKPGSGAGVGALNFSYREFRQTAESKIERELREMREREEELRKLHLHASDMLQEDSSESPAPQQNGQSSEPEVSSRANIGAHWEQMCRN